MTLSTPMPNRTRAAAAAILIYAVIIGFTDNYVRVIAAEAGLWQFHAVRTAIVLGLVLVLQRPLRLQLRPRRPVRVAARSAIHGMAMLVYFGCLAFLPVAQVAAGLFTAPIFVLLISRFAYGTPIGPFRVLAVAVGFVGVLLVLGPGGGQDLRLASVLPVLAGLFYAMGNIATRAWCEGEPAEVLTLGFFLALGAGGVVGLIGLGLWPQVVPAGADGFILRGWVWPSGVFLGWTFVQAAGSLLGVAMMVRGYQMAEASRVSVFEYMILPCSAIWGWVIWGETLGLRSVAGMALIVVAGAIIALRAGHGAAEPLSATAQTP
jgi:drug/metabolite transporter (DMT)-like permease